MKYTLTATVLGLERGSVYKNGKASEYLRVNYYVSSEEVDSSKWSGYKAHEDNVLPRFSETDFPSFPGKYNLTFRVKPDSTIEMEKVEFIKKIELSSQNDAYLVLGVSKQEFKTREKVLKDGCKIFAVDLSYEYKDEQYRGYPFYKPWWDSADLADFDKVPGYYSIDASYIRGQDGETVIKCNGCQYVGDVETSESQGGYQ